MSFSTFSSMSSSNSILKKSGLRPLSTFTITQVPPTSFPVDRYLTYIDSSSNFYALLRSGTGTNNNLYKSTNNGNSWTIINTTDLSKKGMVAKDSVIYVTNTGMIDKTTNAGLNWTRIAASSANSYNDNMLISKTNDQRFFSATHGNSFIINTPHTNNTLRTFSGGNIPTDSYACCGTDNLSTIYVGTSSARVHKVTITWGVDNNNTSLVCNAAVTLNVSGNSVNSLACSSDGTIIYAITGLGQIHKSTNSGASFSVLSNSLNVSDFNNSWRCLACSKDGSIVAALRLKGLIYLSFNGGTTWTTGNSVSGSDIWFTLFMDGTKLLAGGEIGAWIGTMT